MTTSSSAWLFPGQGSQSVGMGKDVLEASKAARRIFERADEALGEKLSTIILEGPEAELTLTANAQPALVTVSIALLEALRERVPNLPAPAFGAGHSLGEYSALVASGALSFEDAIRIVRARGRAMQSAVAPGEGAMAAVMSVDASVLESICQEASEGEVLSLANFNAPGQIVIAGSAGAVARAASRVEAARGKMIPLKVSAPFHCALMAPAAEVVAKAVAGVSLSPLAFPVVANVDAMPNQSPERVAELLTRQVAGAVRWEQSVQYMQANGITSALEIGPGKVLAGLVKRIAKTITVTNIFDAASLDAAATALSAA
ncbi:MAG: ACP S-malonyltransferase [Polyangiaceae bacterium]